MRRASKRRRLASFESTPSSDRSTSSAQGSSSVTPATSRSSPCSPSPASSHPLRLERFLRWCQTQGLVLDPILDLRFSGDEISWSISCHAHSSIPADTVLASIPKSAVLSRKTSALAPQLRGKWLSDDPQTVGLELALCLLYERCLGARSKFEPFIEILPRLPVALPFLTPSWAPSAVWLEGSEAGRIDSRATYAHAAASEWKWDHQYGMSVAFAQTYFHDVGIPILRKTKLFDRAQKDHLEALEAKFLTAYTHVSSRDFIVDTYHGVGLVPVADLFNHNEVHTVQFESDQEVCELCGKPFLTGHEEDECRFGGTAADEREEKEEHLSDNNEDEGMESGEEADFTEDEEAEGSSEAHQRVEGEAETVEGAIFIEQDEAEASGEEGQADEEIEEEEVQYEDTLDMRTLQAHTAGEEIYNTYGPLPNALLLTRYGFCLDTETDVERYTLDLRFPEERKAFFASFTPTVSVSKVQQAFDRVLGAVASDWPKHIDGEDEDAALQLNEEERRERDGLDGLHHLEALLSEEEGKEPEWLQGFFASLFHKPQPQAQSGQQEVDEDLVDRDQIHPLFVDATGRPSRVLFILVLLLHHMAAGQPSSKRKVLDLSSIDTTRQSATAQAALKTIQTLLSTRLQAMHISQRLEQGLNLLHDPKEPYFTKACIHHAYQEHAVYTAALASLSDLITA